MTWRNYALCKGKNVDIWYPPIDVENAEQYYAVAREVCHVCPVWKECLKEGIDENWGMWGGLNTLERSVFKTKTKKTALKAHGTPTRYRQGCRCQRCTEIHTLVIKQNKDISVVPSSFDKEFDLFTILYKLLQ